MPLFIARKLPVPAENGPCYARINSLLWEPKFPVISPLRRHGERPWFATQGPPRRPLSPFGGCSPSALNPSLFNALLFFIRGLPIFRATEPRLVLKCQKDPSNRRRFPGDKKILFVVLNPEFHIMNVASRLRWAPVR